MPRLAKDLLFLAFLGFIITVIVIANQGGTRNLFTFLHQIPHFDKLGHFLLMGLLALFALIAFATRMTSQSRAICKITTILLLIIALEEGSQAFNPNRTFSIPDYLFSAAGVLSAALAYSALSRRTKKECQDPDTL